MASQGFANGTKVLVQQEQGDDEGIRTEVGRVQHSYDGIVLVQLERDGSKVEVLSQRCSLYDDSINGDSEYSEQDEGREEGGEEFHRAITVAEALEAGGWKLKSQRNHLVYERDMTTSSQTPETEIFVMPKTASDHRAGKNSLALLNRLNRGHRSKRSNLTRGEARTCVSCGIVKNQEDFSKSQWSKGKNKCVDCVQKSNVGIKTE